MLDINIILINNQLNMSQSRWLFYDRSSDSNNILNLYLSNILADSVDRTLMKVTCFDKCTDPKNSFKVNTNCMANCDDMIINVVKTKIIIPDHSLSNIKY